MKRAATLVAINAAGLAVLLVFFEAGLRIHGDEFYVRTQPGSFRNTERSWARVDPDLGWVFSGSDIETLRNPHYNSLPIDYRANAQGFRDRRDFDATLREGGRPRILMLGDSFVFGVYLDEDASLPVRLEDALGESHEVLNLGIPGWGVDQMLLAYRKYRDAIAAETVILVYTDYDVTRVFESFRKTEGLGKPSFRLRDGRLEARTVPEIGALERLAGVSLLANRVYRNERWGYRYWESRRIALALLGEFARETAERGETALVVRYPSKRQITRGEMTGRLDFGDEMAPLGAGYLQPEIEGLDESRRLAMYLEHDRHPARAGNAFMAQQIARALGSIRHPVPSGSRGR